MSDNLSVNGEIETIENTVSFKEIVSQKFHAIRFPQYKIACKLRYLQKTSNFYLIDLYNTIESFREFGLNGNSDLSALISASEINTIIYSIYLQLSQRVPTSENIDVQKSVDLIVTWLLETYDPDQNGFISIFAFKIALTFLCSSTYSNKLRYLFTLLSNEEGYLIKSNFDLFLRQLLAITIYFENDPSYFYSEDFESTIFNFSSPVNLTKFLESLTSVENNVELTSWLIVYHRLTDSEHVTHNIACSACGQNPFKGLRYKCKKCSNCNLCQNCFWTGKTSGSHDPSKHPCKEYLFDKSKNQLRRSLRNSFRNSVRCFPVKPNLPTVPTHNDNLTTKRLNLSNIISSPKFEKRSIPSNTYDYKFDDLNVETLELPIFSQNSDQEHNLISQYLNLIKKNPTTSNQCSLDIDNIKSFEKTIESLEIKNRELMKKITELKQMKNQHNNKQFQKQNSSSSDKGLFFDELAMLRSKKDDLEEYLNSLQDKRKGLIVQLDNLMKKFKDGKDFGPTLCMDQNMENNNHCAIESLTEQLSTYQITEDNKHSISHSIIDELDDRELKSKAFISAVAFS